MRLSARFFVFFVSVFAAAASVQAQAAAANKIVIVDTAAFFNEQTGITKIVAAAKTLNTDLAGERAKVQALVQRVDALTKELETIRGNAGRGVPVDERTFQAKVAELDGLKREGKYKEDEFNALARRRQNEIVGPVYSDVLRVLSEYVKSKDYGIIFDVSKDQGLILFASEKFDITKDFIAFYNTRPVTSITSVPK